MIEVSQLEGVPPTNDYDRGELIRTDRVGAIVRAATYGWCTTGARMGGWSFFDAVFETESTDWTATNDGDGQDTDKTPVIIEAQRVEQRALGSRVVTDDGGTYTSDPGTYPVEVQAYGTDVDIRLRLYRYTEDGWTTDPVVDLILTMEGDELEWRSRIVDLYHWATSAQHTYLATLRVRAPADGLTAELRAVSISELRHRSLEYEAGPGLLVYGSEWIGKYAHDELIADWDADGAAHTLSAVGDVRMMREQLATLAHAVELDPADSAHLEATGVELEQDSGLVCALAVYGYDLSGSEGTGGALVKRGAGGAPVVEFDVDLSGTFRVRLTLHDSFTSTTTTHTLSAGLDESAWHDVVLYLDGGRGRIELWVDGEMVHIIRNTGGAIDSNVEAAGPVWIGRDDGVGRWDGRLALPTLITGDIEPIDCQRLIHWRRSLHGIW